MTIGVDLEDIYRDIIQDLGKKILIGKVGDSKVNNQVMFLFIDLNIDTPVEKDIYKNIE